MRIFGIEGLFETTAGKVKSALGTFAVAASVAGAAFATHEFEHSQPFRGAILALGTLAASRLGVGSLVSAGRQLEEGSELKAVDFRNSR